MKVTEIWQDIQHHISNLFALRGVKTFAAILVTAAHQAFGDAWLPIHGAILTLYLLDWITGLGAAIAAGERITSSGGLRGVIKGLIYACVIIVAHQLDCVNAVMSAFGGFVLALVALTEAHSNLENLDAISQSTGLNLPLIGWLIKAVRRYEVWMQEKLTAGIDEKAEKEEEDAQ